MGYYKIRFFTTQAGSNFIDTIITDRMTSQAEMKHKGDNGIWSITVKTIPH